MSKIKFGSEEVTTITDEQGSTYTLAKHFASGQVVSPVRHKYEIRHRTDSTDIHTITEIIRKLITDPTKYDAGLRLERSKDGEREGYFYLVEYYTRLEY